MLYQDAEYNASNLPAMAHKGTYMSSASQHNHSNNIASSIPTLRYNSRKWTEVGRCTAPRRRPLVLHKYQYQTMRHNIETPNSLEMGQCISQPRAPASELT